MPKLDVDSDRRGVLSALLLTLPGVVEGKMFGYPAYYVNGKLFACLYGEGLGVRVPEEVANKLLSEEHVVAFQPLGKPRMREWIQLNRSKPADYGFDLDTLRTAMEFVRERASTKRRKA